MKKGKSVISFSLVTVLLISFLIFIPTEPGGAAEPQYKFRISNITSERAPGGAWIIRFAQVAEQLSKGRIKVDAFPSGVLGGEVDTLSQIKMGTLDLGVMTNPIMGSMEQSFSVCELPYIFKNTTSARKSLDGSIGLKILDRIEAKGYKGLAWGEIGWRGFISKKPINSIEDFKGMKIRVVENPLYILNIKTFGGNPIPMNWLECYTALDQGTIDGVETNYSGMRDAKFYEVAKNVAVTNHIYTTWVMIMNLKTFQGLPQDLQKVVMDAANESREYCREVAVKTDLEAINFFKEKGLIITQPARKPFEDRCPAIYKQFEERAGSSFISGLIKEVIATQK